MRNKRVYDLPLRIFHWSFSGLFIAAFLIAKTQDQDSMTFPLHMLLGLALLSLVVFRVFWGYVGTRYSRFSELPLGFARVKAHLLSALRPNANLTAAHNPASSWVLLLMLLCATGLPLSGVLMVQGVAGELAEEIHEVFADGFVVLTLFHLSGLLLHTLVKRDPLALSMLDGKKSDRAEGDPIPSQGVFSAILLILYLGAMTTFLVRGYDRDARSLRIFGITLQLGEQKED